MLRKTLRRNKGITLIALVVTIIVLLILAGISIAMLTGQNGILNRAAKAKEKTENANEDEQRKLAQAEALMNTEKTTYKGVTLPEGFAPTKIAGEDSIDDGLVITDGYGNEYVWVEVPKTTGVYPTAGVNVTNFNDEEYKKIENDLHTYTSDYRKETSYDDTYASDTTSGWFKNTSAYNTAKQKMLKSVYQNGGFWVGRYEAGIEDETNIRKEKTDTVTLTPVTKKNVYPYNYVTRTQAKVLAEQVEAGSYTSSLMFGVQWDLILKFIEKKTVAKVNEANKENVRIQVLKNLNEDSTNVGNYYNSLWNITNTKAKFSADSGSSFNICPQSKKSSSGVLLTTGADIDFSLMNIYDIAGNVWEFTLENTSSNDESSAASRGGSYGSNGFYASASYRAYNSIGGTLSSIGFRTSLY